jgi:hypothetical protein
MPKLFIPQQRVELYDQGDRLMGTVRIENEDFRIEAYDPCSEMADELYAFAECGGPLQTIWIDNRRMLVAIMPKGGTA